MLKRGGLHELVSKIREGFPMLLPPQDGGDEQSPLVCTVLKTPRRLLAYSVQERIKLKSETKNWKETVGLRSVLHKCKQQTTTLDLLSNDLKTKSKEILKFQEMGKRGQTEKWLEAELSKRKRLRRGCDCNRKRYNDPHSHN